MEAASYEQHDLMRGAAESRLRNRTAPAARVAPHAGLEALQLLHRLASDPTTSADALKLLHELQVNQVELDLMHEQAEASLQELSDRFQRSTAWFDFLPCGCLVLGANGKLQAVNGAAAAWLNQATVASGGEPTADWAGQRLSDLLAPESRVALREALERCHAGATPSHGRLQLLHGTDHRDVMASWPPGGSTAVIVLLPGPLAR